ncbi:nit2-like protein 2 [Dorcoceras hygrometricum]|nr:nit2-like protein 2 [Dorcoceras hygrometricum]
MTKFMISQLLLVILTLMFTTGVVHIHAKEEPLTCDTDLYYNNCDFRSTADVDRCNSKCIESGCLFGGYCIVNLKPPLTACHCAV